VVGRPDCVRGLIRWLKIGLLVKGNEFMDAALYCSPAGTSTNLNYGRDPLEQPLNFKCLTCGPMYEMVNYGDGGGYLMSNRGCPGGYSQLEGAASCTLCNATGTSGYSWRSLACNAT
jgi:hypothetical protein